MQAMAESMALLGNGWFLMCVVLGALLIIRERQYLQDKTKMVDEMREMNERWEKAVAAQRERLAADYQERITLLQEAQNVVWVRVNENGETEFAKTETESEEIH
jgi:hypothetical protein